METFGEISEFCLRLTGASADDLMAPILDRRPTAVWLSGSLVEGLAHDASDIDLYAVVDEIDPALSWTRRLGELAIFVTFRNSRRVDYEFWSNSRVDALAARLAAIDVGATNDSHLDAFDEDELHFMHRLAIGVPLYGHAAVSALRARFPAAALAAYQANNSLCYLDDAMDDAAGMLRSSQWQNAALRARDAAGFALDFVMHCCGDTNNSQKYRWSRLSRLTARDPAMVPLGDAWRELTLSIPRDAPGQIAYTLRALRFCEDAACIRPGEDDGRS